MHERLREGEEEGEGEDPMEEQPQAKRRRRPSVRLGEIGFAAPYEASSLWIEAPRQRRKSAPAEVLSTGKPTGHGAKAPRIRPLEQLAAAEATVVEEEWGVIVPTDGEKLFTDGAGSPGKKPRRAFARKVNTKMRGKGAGGGHLGSTKEGGARVEAPTDADSPETREDEEEEDDDDDEEEEKEVLPLQVDDEAPASTSSGSEELLGSDLKGEEEVPADDSGNGASDDSEEGDPGAKPNSHGDEMQGAIEDGPGQANGKVFSKVKQRPGERRSGRQAAVRVTASRDLASRDVASREIAIRDSGHRDVASRDIAAEPGGRFQSPAAVANGALIVVTPNSNQRGLISEGVSGWLQDLGLGKYSELFELNEVDTEVLPLLTFEDLREMGVDAVGARRKMFNGIQELAQIRGI